MWPGPRPRMSPMSLGLRPTSYQVASWSSSQLATTAIGRRLGAPPPFGEGELGPHLTQCGQGRGLPACEVSYWYSQPFGHSTPASQTGQTGQTDRQTGQDKQRSDSIGRTVLQTVAHKRQHKELFLSSVLLLDLSVESALNSSLTVLYVYSVIVGRMLLF